MSISREGSVSKIYVSGASGLIKIVEFEWSFTDDTKVGVESKHGGAVDISSSGLTTSAAQEQMLDAVDDVLAPQIDQIVAFHAEQIAYLYSVKFSSPIVLRPPTSEDVDAERDRRIMAGFEFDGVLYQTRAEDRENIAGAKSAATDAIALGAQPGDYSWRQLLDPNGPEVFAWIAADNTIYPMDAQTVVRFGYAAMTHKEAHIFAARQIKNMTPIPADYATNASYWP